MVIDPVLQKELEQHVLVTSWSNLLGIVDTVYNWGRRSSLWPLGFGLARLALPFKSGLRFALVAPAVLPPYVIALALSYVGGTLAATLGGAIVALTIVLYPLAMLATEVAVRQIEPRLEEAAILVATPGRVLKRITWPLVAPSVVSTALVIFVLAISEFSVPGLLRVRVFTTEVFTAFAALYDFGRATMLAAPLLSVSAVWQALPRPEWESRGRDRRHVRVGARGVRSVATGRARLIGCAIVTMLSFRWPRLRGPSFHVDRGGRAKLARGRDQQPVPRVLGRDRGDDARGVSWLCASARAPVRSA
jgi:hypothetical protein